MKQLLNKGIFLSISLCLIGLSSVKAQGDIDDLLSIIQEGAAQGNLDLAVQDANTLTEGYIAPLMKGMGLGLCNGWANTAKPHKTAGFDIGIVAGLAFVPDKELFYSVGNLNLLTVQGGGEIPTIFGPDVTPSFQINNPTGATSIINGIPGVDPKNDIGFNAVPYAVPQLGIGIVKGTDIKLRILPEISIGDSDDGETKLKVFGIGVMHDIKQHIPGMKNLPFDLSGLVGYTKVTLTSDFADPTATTTQQISGDFSMKAFTVQALISKKFSIITLFGGVGFNSVSSTLKLNGDFEVDLISDPLVPAVIVTDPIDLSFKAGGPKINAGFRLKLAILTITADYSLQKYSSLTVGVGFAVR